MDSEGEKSKNFYVVLGLKKECTATELRNAYKKLAMKWHPDRCSMSGNVKQAEEAKTKFQAIQEAYSVLSDPNKRFLYDCGVYDCEDEDDQNGMGEFLNEMATMMNQNKPTGNAEENFAELQDLFEEIFQTDVDAFVSSSPSSSSTSSSSSFFSTRCFDPYKDNKRDSSHMNTNSSSENMTNNQFDGFNIGVSFSLLYTFLYSIVYYRTPNLPTVTVTPHQDSIFFLVLLVDIWCDGYEYRSFKLILIKSYNLESFVLFMIVSRQVGLQESTRIRRGVQARGHEWRGWRNSRRDDDCRKQKV